MNPLKDIVSEATRKKLYALYALVGVVIGGLQVAFVAANSGQPQWLTVTLAVYAYVGIALGATAASNTDVSDSKGDHEAPYVGD